MCAFTQPHLHHLTWHRIPRQAKKLEKTAKADKAKKQQEKKELAEKLKTTVGQLALTVRVVWLT